MQDTIKQIKELNEKRTQGHHFNSGGYQCPCDSFPFLVIQKDGHEHKSFDHMEGEDADFASASANAIMPLIDAYEESQKKGESLCQQNGELLIRNHDFQSAVDELLGAVEETLSEGERKPIIRAFTEHKHLRSEAQEDK